MRLWHEALIPYLPRQQLLGQHRECCALRGNGWGKPHATVNYVFKHNIMWLVAYHCKVINEMHRRGYRVDQNWEDLFFRGYHCDPVPASLVATMEFEEAYGVRNKVYPEHDDAYLKECLDNLRNKGIILERFDYEHVGL